MRRLIVLAVAGAAVAASSPATFAAAPTPGCLARVGKPCTFTITAIKSPSGVYSTATSWTIKKGTRIVYKGGKGMTTIAFPAGTYVLSVTAAKGVAGAGKVQH
jgi:hypothetical protein